MADCKRFLLRSPWAARWAREMASDVTQERKQPKAAGVAAVERALTILAAFAQASEPLTLSELSRRSGLYKSPALRLLESPRKFRYRTEDRRVGKGGSGTCRSRGWPYH